MRIIPASKRPTNSGPRVPAKTLQERMAREAAIEKALARYLPLECGHYSTLEVHGIYLSWVPKPGQTYCENCHKYVPISKPPAPPEQSQEALF